MKPWLALSFMLAVAVPSAHAEQENALQKADTLLLAQRTRPDAALFEQAKRIAIQAVKRAPRDASAWTVMAWVHMIEHRFADALLATQKAESLQPDQPRTLALMSDALVELGRYDEAVMRAEQLADIAPGMPAWIRVAHLRFLYNDLEGAIQLMAMAARAGRRSTEETAWTWLDLARLHLHAGDVDGADQDIAAAQRAYPGLPAAFAAKARMKLAQGEAGTASDLFKQALTAQPNAEVALEAWHLARQLDQTGPAKHYAALLEGLARLDAGRSRRALAEYFAETGQTQRALKLAQEELAARPDIYSHATMARILARAGSRPEARKQAQAALALNTPDRQLQADMGAILGELSRREAKW